MSVNDRNHRTRFRDESISYTLTAATDPDRAPLITVVGAKYTIYIQKLKIQRCDFTLDVVDFCDGHWNMVPGVGRYLLFAHGD